MLERHRFRDLGGPANGQADARINGSDYPRRMTHDPKTMNWLRQLQESDPYWYRGHELSARLLLREGKLSGALREATIARQLAPFVDSTATLWTQLIAFRNEVGPDAR